MLVIFKMKVTSTSMNSTMKKSKHLKDGKFVTVAQINTDAIQYMHFQNLTTKPVRILLLPIGWKPMDCGNQAITLHNAVVKEVTKVCEIPVEGCVRFNTVQR